MTRSPFRRSVSSAWRTAAAVTGGLAVAAAVLADEAIPGPVRDFSREIPRIFSELENVVARERMTQVIFD